MSTPIPNLLGIAGTDPTGGAGIQADLKTFGALGTYGMAVVTAVVAQNTQAVQAVSPVSPALVAAQLEAVFSDVAVAAVKIGMVANAEIAATIGEALARYQPAFVVFDPVMAASTKGALMDERQLVRIREVLLPQVSLITPNLREAGRLLDCAPPTDEAGMHACLPGLHGLGVPNVLLKGGHLAGEAVDLLSTPAGVVRLTAPRVQTRHGHGTGCTLSSAIAARWALLEGVAGAEAGSATATPAPPPPATLHTDAMHLEMAVRQAKAYVHGALAHADELRVGHGSGPLHHFWA